MNRLPALLLSLLALAGCRTFVEAEIYPRPLTADKRERVPLVGGYTTFGEGVESSAYAECPPPPEGRDAGADALEAWARCLESHGKYGAAERVRAAAKSAQEGSSPPADPVAQ
jgi:hypothetical protein